MSKVYSHPIFAALAESLRTIYWFAEDLKSFLVRCGISREHVARLDWKYKRTAIRELLDELAASKADGTATVAALIGAVVEQDEGFAHLARLDDGRTKVAEARRALTALKELLGHESVVQHANSAREENKTEAARARADRVEREEALAQLKARFLTLASSSEARLRVSALACRTLPPARPRPAGLVC